PEEKPEDRQEVINFIAKIKTKFQGEDEHVYEAFRDIIKSRDENKPFAELYQDVAALFKYDQDLLKEFASYYY
ncbi:Paired amphipathic helix protein Sin3-like 4, partial [Linum perenne]